MQGNTHRFGGIALGAGASLLAIPVLHIQDPIPFTAVMMAGGAIGSLIPDIDHEGSLIGRKMKPVSHVVRKVCGHRGFTHTLLALFGYGLITILLSALIVDNIGQDVEFANRIFFSIIAATVVGSATIFVLSRLAHIVNHRKLTNVTLLVIAVTFIFAMIEPRVIIGFVPVYMVGSTIGYASHLILDMLTVSGVPLLFPISDHMFRIARLRTGTVEKQVSAVCIFLTFVCLFFIVK